MALDTDVVEELEKSADGFWWLILKRKGIPLQEEFFTEELFSTERSLIGQEIYISGGFSDPIVIFSQTKKVLYLDRSLYEDYGNLDELTDHELFDYLDNL